MWRFPKKLKRELSYATAAAMPLLGIHPEKTIIQNDTCAPTFIAALFTSGQRSNPDVQTDEWIKKTRYIYAMEY